MQFGGKLEKKKKSLRVKFKKDEQQEKKKWICLLRDISSEKLVESSVRWKIYVLFSTFWSDSEKILTALGAWHNFSSS